MMQNWKSGKRITWLQSECEVLFVMFLKYALPNLGAQAWECVFLWPGQSWDKNYKTGRKS
eukprot:1156732-Pelagomonas_calceolata.AAC.10